MTPPTRKQIQRAIANFRQAIPGSGIDMVPTGGGESPAPETYSISGTVYDSDGATAVEGATVALGAASTTSAANGTYTLSGLAAGVSGSLTCTKSGYSWTAISISAMSGNLTSQNYTNWWWATGGIAASCVAAYQPKNAVNYAGSKVNIANPGTYNAVDGSAFPTWDTNTGWSFSEASSQYLTTGGIVPADNWSAIVKFSGVANGTDNQYLFGGRNGASSVTRFFIILNTGVTNNIAYGLGGAASVSPELLSGIVGFAAHQGYRNGVSDGSAIGAWTGGAGAPILIGAHNTTAGTPSPVADLYLTGNIEAIAFFNATIASQIVAMTAAMGTLPPNP